MSVQVALRHSTYYQFDRAVSLSPHEIRLKPAAHSRTPISAYTLTVEPAQPIIHWQQDVYGNFVSRVSFAVPTEYLSITISLIADLTVINPFDFFMEPWAEHYPFAYPDLLKNELSLYLLIDPAGPLFIRWLEKLRQALPSALNTIDFLIQINQAVRNSIAYLLRMEPGVQDPEITLSAGSGSCRDSAWLLILALRHMGIAARFVSGYLIQLRADQIPLNGPAGPATDFADLHAWAEAYIPGAGWIGLDATSGLLTGENHIPLAVAAWPASAAPIIGSTGQCETRLDVHMQVQRVHESSRLTKPYPDKDWQAIEALAQHIEQRQQSRIEQITQAGRLCFVLPADDSEPPVAHAERIEKIAESMLLRLQLNFASNSVRHYNAVSADTIQCDERICSAYWLDHQPVWFAPELMASHIQEITGLQVFRFAKQLCHQLNITPDHLLTAYEHPEFCLDPEWHSSSADTPSAKSAAAIGYVLPLNFISHCTPGWQASRWPLSHQRLYISAGSASLGKRLSRAPALNSAPEESQQMGMFVAIEARDGKLNVFMPRALQLEAYLALIEAVEKTAQECKQPIRLEGHLPPHDTRLSVLSISSYPGGIAVDFPPVPDWQCLCTRVEAIYEAARHNWLHADRSSANSLSLGNSISQNNPFLQQPDLMQGMISYWQHHPALSYLFAGDLFGPAGLAPRPDETGTDKLHELAIVFEQIRAQPARAENLLRPLLADSTANGQRCEFGIDELYAAQSTSGEAGRVTLRAFATPPHYQMYLVQSLLIRSLILQLSETPHLSPLVNWGSQLHDRYMLPHYIEQDILGICRELNTAGYAFDASWLKSFLQVRFPHLGALRVQHMHLELRQAIEPVHLSTDTGSIARIQVKVSGMIIGRHQITCNGRPLPLHATGVAGVYIAGVRYELDGQSPIGDASHTKQLVFDIFDDWDKSVVGGCTYYTASGDSSSLQVNPFITDMDDSHYSAQFSLHGAAQAYIPISKMEPDTDYPLTLDLRRPFQKQGVSC